MEEREKKVRKLIAKYKDKRAELKVKIRDKSLPMEDRIKYMHELDALPKSSSYVRARNRCALTQRARGYYGFFGLCRHALKLLAYKGQLPGVYRASW